MGFDWRTFLQLAKELYQQDSPSLKEACLRTCVSRAYYSVFNLALSFLKDGMGAEPPTDKDVHKWTIDFYKLEDSFGTLEKKIGAEVDRLRQERNDADYDAEQVINTRRAELALGYAGQVLENLRQIGAVT